MHWSTAGRSPVEAVYWTKGERFVAVEPHPGGVGVPGRRPQGARELRFVAQPGGGFFTTKAGASGAKSAAMDFDVLVNCCHGGRARTAPLQAALDLAGRGLYRPVGGGGDTCAWTSSPSGPSRR